MSPGLRSSIVAAPAPTTLRHSDFDHLELGPYPEFAHGFVLDVELRDHGWNCVLAL